MHKVASFRGVVLAGAAIPAFAIAGAVQAAPMLVPTGYASATGGENVRIKLTSPSIDRDVLAGGFAGMQTDLFSPSPSTILFWSSSSIKSLVSVARTLTMSRQTGSDAAEN